MYTIGNTLYEIVCLKIKREPINNQVVRCFQTQNLLKESLVTRIQRSRYQHYLKN